MVPSKRGAALTRSLTLLLPAALLFQGCTLVGGSSASPPSPVPEAPETPEASSSAWTQTGVASWYGEDFHGRDTASGEPYDMNDLTCAHPTLSFGTRLRVENLDNGRSVIVRVNDRGPFAKSRILDVSRKAAQELGMIGPGTARVRISVVEAGR
ncbi:MAG: septal ring lytic transglycosylase RlpA family protein [Longimicrobiales bacterium]